MELAEREIETGSSSNEALRDEMITEYLPYVKSIAYRMSVNLPRNIETEDLVNAGVIGLMNAIERYDATRENKFITYALFRIRGAILSELRSRDFLSRSNRTKIRELDKAHQDLNARLGREPEDRDLAEKMGVSLEQLHEIRNLSTLSFVSFEEIGGLSDDDKEHLMHRLVDSDMNDPSSLAGLNELKCAMASAIDQLKEKEKMVVSMYYYDELTMKEIGEVLEITESRVSQIHSQALMHLRTKLRKEGLSVN